MHSFWLSCQNYTSDNSFLSIIESITNIDLDDCIWCVTQLKKMKCNKEIINIIMPEIEKSIISEYKNECLLYLRYGIYKYYPFGWYRNILGKDISNRMGAFDFDVLVSQKNLAICNQYLDYLDENQCNDNYLVHTRKNLQVVLQYLYCNKNNKFILDINENDIQDFKNYINNLNVAPKSLHCLLGTIYSIRRYKNDKYNIAINLNELIDTRLYGLSYILCKYYKRVSQIRKITNNEINEIFGDDDFKEWLESDGEMPLNFADLINVEKLVFNKKIYVTLLFNELSYSTSVDIKKHNDVFGNNCFDYILCCSYESQKMLYNFVQFEYQNGNSIKNILLYVDSILHYKNVDENTIINLLGFIEGIYMTLEISQNNNKQKEIKK